MPKTDFSAIRSKQNLPDPSTVDKSRIIEDLWQDYYDSTTSVLPDLEAAALSLESGRDPDENTAAIKRILHSIKGESGMTGMLEVHDLCHEVESAIDQLADDLKTADMVLRAKDWINEVILRLAGEDQPTDDKPLKTQNLPAEQPQAQKPQIPRALIIDDAVVCRKRIKMLLRNYFDCDFATDGLKGYEAYCRSVEKGEPFSLVTLDINMPEMDGHETLEAIRAYETTKSINGLDGVKIIMTTSHDESSHVFQAFRQGCEAYVVKSHMGEKMLEEISKLGLLKIRSYIPEGSKAVSVTGNTSVFDALETMTHNGLAALPIADKNGRIVRMLTQKQAMELLHSTSDVSGNVEEYATADFTSFDIEDSLIDLVSHIRDKNSLAVPVTKEGRLFTLVSTAGIIEQIVSLRKSAEKSE